MFAGRSSLRSNEAKPPPPVNKALQDYLAKYTNGDDAAQKKKKRKKKPKAVLAGVRIVDEDVSGFAVPSAAADADEEDDEAPIIANEEEAERARRQVETAQRGFYGQQEGSGTGWHSLPEPDSAQRDRQRHDSDDDASPPRRRQRHDSDDDASPPRRRQQHDSDDDASPLRRRQRHDSDDGASPPRRRQRHDSDNDASPLRQGQRHDFDDDASPLRRRQRHDSDDDASPPRRDQRHDSDDDASQPRRKPDAGADSDASPPRRGRKRSASRDISPPRKRAQASPDSSRLAAGAKLMTDGTRSGMVSGKELQDELRRKKVADMARIAALDSSVSGRNATTVHRDKSGKEVSEEELRAAKEAEIKQKEWVAPEWAGGVKQQRDAEAARAERAKQAALPFARTREDLDKDAAHRERLRFGDPMAHLVKKKLTDLPPASVLPAGMHQKPGFVVPQDVPKHSWLKRNLGAPPNRYGIKPGRHWDGVDRSNGFEREMFKTKNAQASAYAAERAWGQEDM